jgi:CrcB protein
MLADVALLSFGAIIGATSRYAVVQSSVFKACPHWGIVGVNIAGSFLLGSLAASPAGRSQKLLVGVGFCGSLTTFSTFAVDLVSMVEGRKYGLAAQYFCANNLGGPGAAVCGLLLTRSLLISK